MDNVEQTIQRQYLNSPIITSLIDSMNAAIDPSADIDNFYIWVWDVATAQGFGLDIWGRIVGVSRTLLTTPATVLDDSDYRSLILLKALGNISASNSYSINTVLLNWLGNVRAYVNDLGNMEMLLNFEFLLTPVQLAILQYAGIFPLPAAVGCWIQTHTYPVMTFKEFGSLASPMSYAPMSGGLESAA